MRSPAFAFAFVFAVAFSGYAFADPQPLTRADCEKASMKWDELGECLRQLSRCQRGRGAGRSVERKLICRRASAADPRGLRKGQHGVE